ncbi:MAG: hypothetical protein ACK52W_04130, partial [Alphaproteobacteria bacterium]
MNIITSAKNKVYIIVLQACVLQLCELAPEQSAPPFAGAGLVQLRVCIPPPHDAEQALQSLHPPLTGQASLGRLQLSVVPPCWPRHCQVTFPPQVPTLPLADMPDQQAQSVP